MEKAVLPGAVVMGRDALKPEVQPQTLAAVLHLAHGLDRTVARVVGPA